MRARGHAVIEVDASARLAAASIALSGQPVVVGDVARLPLRSGIADLAVAFMSFQDVDDMPAAVAETARVLRPGGRFLMAIVHPINSGGEFEPGSVEMERRFVMTESYFSHRAYADDVERDGHTMRFASEHRPIESYSRALEAAGFVIEALREVGDREGKWTRMPLFLDVAAVRR
jgi:SAM-dependent methyltransferase